MSSAFRTSDLFLKSLGEALRSRRKRKKLSQQALSIKAGLAANAVGDLERGCRAIQTQELVKICAVLEVPASVFLEEVRASGLNTWIETLRDLLSRSAMTSGQSSGQA